MRPAVLRSAALLVLFGTAAALSARAAAPLARPASRSSLAAASRAARRRAPSPVAVVRDDNNAGGWWSTSALSKGVRRWIFNTIEPLDKGDFRWEFLVPFNNKTLTTLDKFVVCSTFVGTSFTLQTLFDPGASVGVHLSYIAQFFSYAGGDPIGFRLLAVLTSVLEIGGNLFETKEAGGLVTGFDFNLANAFGNVNEEDVFPILYDQLFIVINGYYILRWLLTQETLASAFEWRGEEESLYTECFAPLGFRRAQFSRLLRSAQFVLADEATALTVQGEPVLDLFVPLNGTVEVRVGGAVASTLPPYQLVGEASLLENLQSKGGEVHPPARATVVAVPGCYYVRWPQSAFYDLQQEEDSDFGYAVQLMIARTLSQKLSAARRSQSVNEQQLANRLSARMSGASAEVLAERRLGRAGSAPEAAAAPPPRQRPAAAAEVTALLEQNKQKEERLLSLERSLAQRSNEVADLKLIVKLLIGVGVVQAATSFAGSFLSGWLPELAMASEFSL